MNERVRACLAAGLYFSGVVPLVRWRRRRTSHTVTILNYHRATPGDLRQHLLYLRRHYRVLPLERALEELYDDTLDVTGAADERGPALALTFDDGYFDNLTVAAALARELQMPITIFLASGYVRSGEPFWWVECERLVRGARGGTITIGSQTYRCDGRRARRAMLRALVDRIEHAKTVTEREAMLREIQVALSSSPALRPPDPQTRPLTWGEVQTMEQRGWVTFGAHTRHHPVLGYLSDADEMSREVAGSRADVEEQLGHPVHAFAYPVGQREHIGERAPSTVREVGFTWALTTIPGTNTAKTDPYFLCRIYTDPGQHWLVVAAQAAGVYSFCTQFVRASAKPLAHFSTRKARRSA